MAVTFTVLSAPYTQLNDTISWQNELQMLVRPNVSYNNRAQLEGDWYLNWALWIDNGGSYGESPTQWKLPALFVNIPATGLVALPITYSLVLIMPAGGGANLNNNKIVAGKLIFTQNGANIDISVTLYHFLHSDYLDYQNGTSWNNLRKYLRNSLGATSDLTNTSPAAYNYQKVARLRLYVKQSNSGDVSVIQRNFTAQPRWYNRDALDTAIAGLSNPSFVLQRGVGVVNTLSTIEDTQVTFSTTGNYTTPHFVLVRVGTFNQSQTQLNSQSTSYAQIPTLVPPVFLGLPVTNVAFKPPAAAGANTHTAYIDRNQLVPFARYRIIAVVQNAAKMYSFISNEFTAENTLPILPPFASDYIADVEAEVSTRWLNTTVDERVRSRVVWDGTPYNVNKLSPFASSLSKIIVRLYWQEVVGANTFQHVVELNARTPDPISGWTAPNKITVSIVGQVVEMYYDFINRAEPLTANIESLINGAIMATPQVNQDWQSRTIIIEWTLELTQPAQGSTAPFTDTIVRTHKTLVRPYISSLTFEFFDPIDPQGDFICTTQPLTELKVTGGGTEFAAWLFKTNPFALNNREEEETFASFLPALDSPKYAPPPDPNFVANEAFADIDNTILGVNVPHKVGMITIADPFVCSNEGQAIINRMTALGTEPTNVRKELICSTVQALMDCGIWDRLQTFNIYAAHSDLAAQVDWKCPTNSILFQINPPFQDLPIFTADIGYTGDGIAHVFYIGGFYLTAPCGLAAGISDIYNNLGFDGATFGIYVKNKGLDADTDIRMQMGVFPATDGIELSPLRVRLFSSVAETLPVGLRNQIGLKMLQRVRSNQNVLEYYNDGNLTSFSNTFAASTNYTFNAYLNGWVFTPASYATLSAGINSYNLSPAQHVCLSDIIENYLQSI